MTVAEKAKAGIKNWPVAKHVKELQTSIIREILKFSSEPGVISFAGGLPAPELFPLEAIKGSMAKALDEFGPACVQYSISQGIVPLRQLLAERATAAGEPSTADNILITSGSQQGLEMLARVFATRGDYILTENPTYVGALQAFNFYGVKYAPVAMDSDGMIIDQVEDKIKAFKPKFIYTISNFQNPTGITMSRSRREALVELGLKYDIPIVDDNPYGDIRFAGQAEPSIKSLSPESVIALHTFSKTCTPGLRIAWINAPKAVVGDFEKVKQGTDLHTNTLCQYIMYEFLKDGLLGPHIEKIKVDYLVKRDTMLAAMRDYFPDGVTWTEPEGGLFLWVELPEHMSAVDLFQKAIDLKVAYVYGQPFHPDGTGANTLRLNFSNATHENLRIGIERLGKLFRDSM